MYVTMVMRYGLALGLVGAFSMIVKTDGSFAALRGTMTCDLAGPEYEGCACWTSRHGCCEDGLTAARGPRAEGCRGCEAAALGCCEDGVTARTEAGCGCAGARHGCCPDGVTAAAGDKFQVRQHEAQYSDL